MLRNIFYISILVLIFQSVPAGESLKNHNGCGFMVCPDFSMGGASSSETVYFLAGAIHYSLLYSANLELENGRDVLCFNGSLPELAPLINFLNIYLEGNCTAETVMNYTNLYFLKNFSCSQNKK